MQCDVALHQNNRITQVTGLGDTEKQARADAETWAWRLAAYRNAPGLRSLLLLEPGLVDIAQTWSPEALIPGARLEPGTCLQSPTPRAAAYEAAVGERSVVRRDPVVAARAVRRQACMEAASASVLSIPRDNAVPAIEALGEGLAACLSTLPVLTAASPRGTDTTRKGTWRCVDPGPMQADAIGPTLEHAREAALDAFVDAQIFTGLAEAWAAHARSSDEERDKDVKQGLYRLAITTGVHDLTERHVLACSLAPRKTTVDVRWSMGGYDARDCGPDAMALLGSDVTHDERRNLCDGSQDPGVTRLQTYLREPQEVDLDKVAANGLAIVFACRSGCRRAASTIVTNARPHAPRSVLQLRAEAQAAREDLPRFLALFHSINHPNIQHLRDDPHALERIAALDVNAMPTVMVDGRAYFRFDP